MTTQPSSSLGLFKRFLFIPLALLISIIIIITYPNNTYKINKHMNEGKFINAIYEANRILSQKPAAANILELKGLSYGLYNTANQSLGTIDVKDKIIDSFALSAKYRIIESKNRVFDSPLTFFILGRTYYQMGPNYYEIAAYYLRTFYHKVKENHELINTELFPGFLLSINYLHLLLGITTFHNGFYEEALEYFEFLEKGAPQNIINYYIAKIHANLEDYDLSLTYYKKFTHLVSPEEKNIGTALESSLHNMRRIYFYNLQEASEDVAKRKDLYTTMQKEFEMLKEVHPYNATIYYILGRIKERQMYESYVSVNSKETLQKEACNLYKKAEDLKAGVASIKIFLWCH